MPATIADLAAAHKALANAKLAELQAKAALDAATATLGPQFAAAQFARQQAQAAYDVCVSTLGPGEAAKL
jgi:hypothetical protein